MAEDAGLFHPRVRTVVQPADGGGWIENRWASLGPPAGVEVVDILDFRQLQQHIWGAAKASCEDGRSRTKVWSKAQIDAGVRVVHTERLKNACMHWSVAGARAVLALRAVALSPLRRWHAFWADRRWMERPSTRALAPLRKVA